MDDYQTTITARAPESLKRAFEAAAAANDRTASQLIREFMRDYVQKNAQGDLLKAKR